jgi:DsbC/DsbD-like thiol-disulfide interchange protein
MAGATPWQELSPGVRLRLVTSDRIDAAGRTLVGLDLDMPDNTRTYWKAPGEGGLALSLDWAGSRGIANEAVLWPYPVIDQSAGVDEFVYFGPALLPIALTLASPVGEIAVSVVMGICETQCLPARASFTLPINGTGRIDTQNDLRLRQAEALAPIAWPGSGPAATVLGLDRKAGGLLVRLDDASIDPASLIGVDATGAALGAPQKSLQPNLVLLPVSPDRVGDLEGSRIELNFMTPSGAYSISTDISVSTDLEQGSTDTGP